MRVAEAGIAELQSVVDTLIIIPNQNLFRIANEKTTFTQAFMMADDVLYQGVKGVTDLMVRPGIINLDFADVRSVMDEMGKAMMGTGEASGEDRAVQAAEKAIANPLLDEISLHGAKGVLINITGGYDLTLFELDEAANIIREKVDPDANIIVGSTLDTTMDGRIRVSVVATGIDASAANRAETPATRRSMATPLTAFTPPEPRSEVPLTVQMTPIAATPAPVQRPVAAEPDMFETTSDLTEDLAEEAALEDELPLPVYRPQPAAQVQPPVARPRVNEDVATGFVAPRPRPAGQPSAEALARLQAAVSRSPLQQRPAAPAPVAKPAVERPRFGIGSLINRMAGGSAPEAPVAPPVARQQPPVTHYDDEPEMGSDQERIEIPAFLRRQAN
jgi:cell division protein FtsZ